MKAIVDQALGHVFCTDALGSAGAVLQGPQIEDALVRHAAALDTGDVATVVHLIGVGQARGDVVGRQDRGLGCRLQSLGAHHAHVHPTDRQHRGVSERRCADGAYPLAVANSCAAMCRQERHQVGHHAHRADTRAAPAVRNAEGLVQVEMAHVAAELAGCRHTDQRVQVRAIDIDAAAMAVDQRAQFFDMRVEHAIGGWVGDHHCAEPRAVLLAPGLQVRQIDVALGIALRHHHLHARHVCTGRIGAMRRLRNQADATLPVATRLMAGLDDQQAGVFTLRAGVGLQADAAVAGGLAQPGFELLAQRVVAGQLVERREGVQVGEFRPGDGDHLAGGVELHGARAQRDHRAVQRQVLVGQAADVAQHVGLAVVAVEYRVRKEGAGARQRRRDQRGDAIFEPVETGQGAATGKQRPQRRDVLARRRLIERDTNARRRVEAQVVACIARRLHHGVGLGARVDLHRVEGAGIQQSAAKLPQARRQIDRVHAGHHSGKHLCRADVTGGFLAADMLLARLQRQTIGRRTMHVDAHAHEPARHRALELVPGGEVGRMRPAVAHGHAETLRVAHRDIGAQFAGRDDQRQRQQVGGGDDHATARMHGIADRLQVAHHAIDTGVLQQHRECIGVTGGVSGARHHHNTQRPGAGLHHFQRLRQHIVGNEEGRRFALAHAHRQRHGLGGRRGLVEHRSTGDGHAGQVAHHGLEVDQRFQPALGNLRLIRRIGGVPGRVFEYVAQDDSGRVRAVVALADTALEHLVLRGDAFQLGQRLRLGQHRRQRHGLAAHNVARHERLDQRAPRCGTNDREHVAFAVCLNADVAGDEFSGVLKLEKRLLRG